MVDHKLYSAGTVALFTLTLSALPAMAATERQLDSHEHGHAQINMALSGSEVLAELISPAANVVGFEHAPGNNEDRMAITQAVETLSSGEQLFIFSAGAECSLLSAEVESSLLQDADGHDDHDDHDADEKHDDHDDHDADEKHDDHDDHDADEKHDDHDDHDADEKHDDHDHDAEEKHDDHDHDAHSDNVHSEFHVTWSFNCANPDELKSIQVMLFDTFSGFEEIDVSLATDDSQSSFELSSDQFEIAL